MKAALFSPQILYIYIYTHTHLNLLAKSASVSSVPLFLWVMLQITQLWFKQTVNLLGLDKLQLRKICCAGSNKEFRATCFSWLLPLICHSEKFNTNRQISSALLSFCCSGRGNAVWRAISDPWKVNSRIPKHNAWKMLVLAELHLMQFSLMMEFYRILRNPIFNGLSLSFEADWAHCRDVIYKEYMKRIN